MADAPYLVALALMEQNGRRALPLGGRSLPADSASGLTGDSPHAIARELALELLLRVWQRSDEGSLQRAAGPASLLLVELPMERLPEDLPALKAAWLNTGDTVAFEEGLQAIVGRAWTVAIEKFQPLTFTPWSR